MGIVVAILVFGLIVLFHEFGHFLVARKNGIVVKEFMIGMGPKLVGIKRGDTLYSIRLLPIGGACVMLDEDGLGEEDEAEEGGDAADKEKPVKRDEPKEPLPGSFAASSVWARIAVIFAGPFFNFILAFICALILTVVNGYTTGEIVEVSPGTPAEEAGLEAGDVLIKVDSERVLTFSDFSNYVALSGGKEITVTFERDGETKTVNVQPEMTDDGVYRIGIVGGVEEKPGFFGTLRLSLHAVGTEIKLVLRSLELMIHGQVSRNDISGPVGIFQVIGDSYSEAAHYGALVVMLTICNLILLLSANLGVMNLLPLPALDGGRLVFLFLEAIRGKPVSREKEGMVHFIGFVVLMVFMGLIMVNDINRIFGGM